MDTVGLDIWDMFKHAEMAQPLSSQDIGGGYLSNKDLGVLIAFSSSEFSIVIRNAIGMLRVRSAVTYRPSEV